MKPNFALGLTGSGITLWQRDGADWLRVGAVPLDATDRDIKIQHLVAEAHDLAPDGIATKLVIPDDQILYTHLSCANEAAAIRAALDGKTPYPVAELEFDWTVQGDQILAAVVARETLVEAEEFAKAQGLNPVCFVAAPDAQAFPHEPFFKVARGVTQTAAELGMRGAILRETGVIKPRAPQSAAATQPPANPAPGAAPTPPKQSPPATPKNGAKTAEKTLPSDAPLGKRSPDDQAANTPATPDAPVETPVETPVSFRSRRAAPPPDAQTFAAPPSATIAANTAPVPAVTPARASKALSALGKTRSLSLGSLGGAALAEKLRASVAAPVARAGGGLRTASDMLGRKLTSSKPKPSKPTPKGPPDAQAIAPITAPPEKPTPVQAAAPGSGQAAKPGLKQRAKLAFTPRDKTDPDPAAVVKRRDAARSERDPEAERLTVFGARRSAMTPEQSLPRRALLITGAALLVVLAVLVWVFYFTRAPMSDLAQPDSGIEAPTQIAAPDPLALPDTSQQAAQDIEAALGVTDAAQDQGSAPDQTIDLAERDATSPGAPSPAPVIPTDASGRLAALRSVRAIAPDAPADLPKVQAAPAPFGSDPLPPLREAVETIVADVADPANVDAPTTLPSGEEALQIAVQTGRPPATPPARPAGIAPAPDPAPQPEPAPELATPLQPLDESSLVIDVNDGAPTKVPPARPAGIAPETAPSEPPAPQVAPEDDGNATAEEADQASLAPPPGGVVLRMFAPAARPAAIEQQAAAQPDLFADVTPQAVAASLRPSNRPSGFSQTVQRALAASRIRAVAPAEQEPETIVRASAASVAPRIPSSASVSREATQARAINLRKINLLGVTGTPTTRRALVRLDTGRVVTVQVGERLDGGQVTAIGDSELRYNKRGRDVVLRIAS